MPAREMFTARHSSSGLGLTSRLQSRSRSRQTVRLTFANSARGQEHDNRPIASARRHRDDGGPRDQLRLRLWRFRAHAGFSSASGSQSRRRLAGKAAPGPAVPKHVRPSRPASFASADPVGGSSAGNNGSEYPPQPWRTRFGPIARRLGPNAQALREPDPQVNQHLLIIWRGSQSPVSRLACISWFDSLHQVYFKE